MNTISRLISGWTMIVGGLFLLGVGFFHWGAEANWVAWMYGVIIFILGWFILFNKKEDKIEEINYSPRDDLEGPKGGAQDRVPSDKKIIKEGKKNG